MHSVHCSESCCSLCVLIWEILFSVAFFVAQVSLFDAGLILLIRGLSNLPPCVMGHPPCWDEFKVLRLHTHLESAHVYNSYNFYINCALLLLFNILDYIYLKYYTRLAAGYLTSIERNMPKVDFNVECRADLTSQTL